MSDETLLMRQLHAAAGARDLVEIDRDGLDAETLVGRVLGVSEHVVLIEKLDDDAAPDGVSAVRPADITRLKWGTNRLEKEQSKARWKRPPKIDRVALLELSAAATMLNRMFGYVTVYVEALASSMCFVGELIDVDDDFISMKTYAPAPSLDRGYLVLRYASITRIDGGGQYASDVVAAHRRDGARQRRVKRSTR